MSLDISLMKCVRTDVYSDNITHNLTAMADAAGIYKHLWRPEEIGIKLAVQLVEPLKAALESLKENPEYWKRFDPPNGWGNHQVFVSFVEDYLAACEAHPDAEIEVSR